MKLTKLFDDWFNKWEEDKMHCECSKSYYDPDTGHTDLESARYDELFEAFEAGFAEGKK